MSPCNVLLTKISASTSKDSVASDQTIIPDAKRSRCVCLSNSTTAIMHDETNLDALRVTVFEMRKDIQSLTKCQNVMTEKNDKLQEELATVKSRLNSDDFQSEKQNLVQKLSAANQLNCDLTDTNGKLREDLNIAKNHSANLECNLQNFLQKLSAADEVNVKLTETNIKLQENLNAANNHFTDMEMNLQCRIQDLVHKLSAADRMSIELTDTNEKLRQEMNAVRGHVANNESNLQCQIQDLVLKLSAADRKNVELNETNGKIKEDLNAANIHFTDMESILQCQIQDLVHKLSAADRKNVELNETNGKIKEDLNAANIHFTDMESILQCQIQDLVHKLSAADRKNVELNETNGKIKEDLNAANIHFTDMESILQCQIQDLVHKLSAADQMNVELTDTNGKLQQKLNEKVSDLKARTNELINEFRTRMEESEKMNAQLAGKNEKLQKELNILSQNAGKEKELFQLNSLLPNRPETDIQTERMEVSDIHNGYDQVKSGECVTVEPKQGAINGNQAFPWKEDFVSDDPIVQQFRPILMQQKFGWMKFQPRKKTKFRPAFVYPADDKGGLEQAQSITKDGCISLAKNSFSEFHFGSELPDDKKGSTEILWLKKFNDKYGAYFK